MTRVRHKAIKAARAENTQVWTGRTRRRWLFWTQWEYEGPVFVGRWQTPFNVKKWPRRRYWLYQSPVSA
jgi:hypothetical protein